MLKNHFLLAKSYLSIVDFGYKFYFDTINDKNTSITFFEFYTELSVILNSYFNLGEEYLTLKWLEKYEDLSLRDSVLK